MRTIEKEKQELSYIFDDILSNYRRLCSIPTPKIIEKKDGENVVNSSKKN